MSARRLFLLVTLIFLVAGCGSTGDNVNVYGSVGVGYYSGSGWYDRHYRPGCCYGGVRPPPNRPPPGNRPPPNRPPPGSRPPRPTPMPSTPSRPRPRR
ncbi:MAG: hypothetical protein GWP74_00795 [Proteobacteria bacterium]|nr:hypothetical protein [Pseudomonadota bacterium]